MTVTEALAEVDRQSKPRTGPRSNYEIALEALASAVRAQLPGGSQHLVQTETVDHVLAAVSGTVFRSETGEVIILLNEDNYAISVDPDGHTVSAYLVTVPPAEIAAAMSADPGEISGWSTGWDC
jgi:hypothetical protein